MTQEQKAKAYDEALKRAKSLIGDTIVYESGQHIAEVIFPELFEDKDERARKELVDFLSELIKLGKNTNFDRWDKADCANWLDWLEKQDTSDPYNGVSFEYNGHTWGMCARDNGVDILCDKHIVEHLEKQSEQKQKFNSIIQIPDGCYAYIKDRKVYIENYAKKDYESNFYMETYYRNPHGTLDK